jgi:uncharacterized glyoxalase superfamily protein PhnB
MTSTEQARTDALPSPTVWLTLQARDAEALIEYYVTTFGFLRTAVYTEGDQVVHAQLDWPEGGGIMLGSYRPDAEWNRQPGTAGAYVVTARVSELYAQVRAAGATIRRELAEQSYGAREFSVEDPEGNLWSFGDYRGEPRPT